MAEQSHVWRIDGIEEGVARVEEDGERMITLPRHLLPAGAREGQVVRVTRAASGKRSVTLTMTIDDAATAAGVGKPAFPSPGASKVYTSPLMSRQPGTAAVRNSPSTAHPV